MEKILVNKIRCKRCGDAIESKDQHQFISCKCGAVAIDGGHYHLSRTGNQEDWEELSKVVDTTESSDDLFDTLKGQNVLFRIKIEQLIEDLENKTANRNMNDFEKGRYEALCEVLDLIDER